MFGIVDGRTEDAGVTGILLTGCSSQTGCSSYSTNSVGRVLDSCPRGHKFESLPWLIVVFLSKTSLLSTGSNV